MKHRQGINDWRSFRNIWFAGVLIFLVFFGISRLMGADNMGLNWDAPILIDGSYRVFLGQKPHHDFSTPIGPIYFAIGAIGMHLTSPTIAGLNFGLVLFGVLLLGICLYMFRGLSKGSLGLFLLILGSYLFTGRMLHADNPAAGGYTGLYNLYGYCLFFIASAYLNFFDNRQDQKLGKKEIIESAFIALLLILALFIKNIFGIALLLLIIIFRFNSCYKKFYASFFLVATTLFFLLLVWLNFDIQAIIRDQIFVISARLSGGGILGIASAWNFLKVTWLDNLYILIAILLSKNLLSSEHWYGLLKLGIFYIFAAYLFCSAIMQTPVHVLSVFFAVIVVYQLSNDCAVTDYFAIFKKYLLIVISLGLVINALYMNTWAAIISAEQIVKMRPNFNVQSSRFATEGLLNPHLKSAVKSGDHILSVGENDWFNFYYLNTPPLNTLLYWHNTVTFNQQLLDKDTYFSAENIFNDVDLVYLNATRHADTVQVFYNHYFKFLEQNYSIIYGDAKIKIYRKVKATLN